MNPNCIRFANTLIEFGIFWFWKKGEEGGRSEGKSTKGERKEWWVICERRRIDKGEREGKVWF